MTGKEELAGFMRAMYCLSLARSNNGDFPNGSMEVLRESHESAMRFVRVNGMGEPQFKSLFAQIFIDKHCAKSGAKLALCLKSWKGRARTLKSNTSISKVELGILNDLRGYLQGGSASAYLRLEASASYTRDARIYENFLPETQDPRQCLSELRAIVREHTGIKGQTIPLDVLAGLRKSDPEAVKAYNKARQKLRKVYLKELLAYVRRSGRELLPVREVRAHMKGLGVSTNIPKGFEGQIDEKAKLYTKPGHEHPGRQLKTNPSGPCAMNPQYDPDDDNMYVLKSQALGAATEQQYYTLDFFRRGQLEKFKKVEKAIPLIDAARKQWRADMMGASLRAMQAMLCEVTYLTSARIGTRDGNVSKGHRVYGISTLRCKHVKVSDDALTFSYHAKSGMKQRHVIKAVDKYTRRIHAYVKSRKATSQPSDLLFAFEGRRVQPQKVNDYIRELGLPITIHKFRTVHGTSLFRKLAAKSDKLSRPKLDDKALNAEIDRILEEVGAELGHFTNTDDGQKVTGNTALAYYINPVSVARQYDRFKVRYPNKLLKVIDNESNGEDS